MTTSLAKRVVTVLSITAAVAGCSSTGGKKGEELASNGPTVLRPRTDPKEIELNSELQPKQPAEVLAEVKDFTAPVTDVKLRFVRVPLEVPMEHIGGTTWRARLSTQQLKTLAISGETVNYQANIIARNRDGRVAMNEEPLQISIKTPEIKAPTS